MPLKWVLHWQPNAGTTVNTQILNEVSQCVESINGVKEGRWKATLTYYKPILREPSQAAELPREFFGISLPEQPNKYYFIIRDQRIVLEADSSIQTIMEKLQSYKSRIAVYFEGFQYQLGDFQLRVGKVTPTHSDNLRGIIMEVEYLPLSSVEKSRQVMEEFVDIWHEAIAKRSLPGHFMHMEPNFVEYGLTDHYGSQHTAVQYATVMAQQVATQVQSCVVRSNFHGACDWTQSFALAALRSLATLLRRQQHLFSYTYKLSLQMGSKPPQDAPRKYRFMPKVPPRRVPNPEVKTEKVENVGTLQAMNLMKQFQKPDIAFGPGAAAPRPSRSWSTINRDQGSSSNGSANAPGLREKEYVEPWVGLLQLLSRESPYEEAILRKSSCTHFAMIKALPIYLIGSKLAAGLSCLQSFLDSILDEEEFGEASESVTHDENSTNSAVELGLMEENVEASLLFIQLPPTVPMIRRSATADTPDVKESSRPSGGARAIEKTCGLDELPAGYMGKVLVYRSGAVKLKLGDTLYDVSPGMSSTFAQDVVAINRGEKTCCVVAEIEKRATLTPDVDAIISSVAKL
ncbi:unnamed protein product [Dovyalis caffra]|uniref:Mediator of RNA polymerase II transcription subunit 20 n=1 Tax=Dovyalis caffra TaxID=77055 RepID=A0AAV1SNF3_9ROSI|nr:unnamed protein product [Dovyalis caffra]